MDDGADVGRLRVEDLCGLNTFMNTVWTSGSWCNAVLQ